MCPDSAPVSLADRQFFTGLRLFGDAQLQVLHEASLEILQRTGVKVTEPQALDLLREAGCQVEGVVARFPPQVVENALQNLPSQVTLYNRNGQPSLFLEGERSYFGSGSDLPFTLDLETGQRRPTVLEDVKNAARLVDALPNMDFVMSMGLPSDAPAQTADRHNFFHMVANTTKPVVFTAWDETGLQDILELAEIVAGSRQDLESKPFLVAYLEPISPLQHAPEVLRKMFRLADYGLPYVLSPAPIDGGTAPVTLAGCVAQANAETLSGMVIGQLYRPGSPIIWGAGCGPLDMRTLVNIYAGPQTMLHCMAMAELAHHLYHVPVWGFGGCSDSKLPDVQAGGEGAMMTMWNTLAGANLIHDMGYLESGLTCSLEMIAIHDEINGQIRQLLQGIEITPQTLALDVIDEVGPGGSFLAHDHTAKNFRGVWYPRLFDRRAYAAWQSKGEPNALGNARKYVQEVLKSHQPIPLPEEKLKAMQAVLKRVA